MLRKFSLIAVLAVFGVFLYAYTPEVAGEYTTSSVEQVQVISNNLNLRTGAGTTHSTITTLHKGAIVEVIGEIGNWYVVKTSDDTVGCVIMQYVTPYKETTPTPGSSAEIQAMQQEMLGYINAERAKVGLQPLTLATNLCEGAQMKSQDMVDNSYFSHESPTYGSPFEMMAQLGITYRYAGENIAKHFSVKGAHDAFMSSSGHRANILNGQFNKVGLGFVQDGAYLYVTQWFTN